MTKRRDLVRMLKLAGWQWDTGFRGPHEKMRKGSKSIPIPRHREIEDDFVKVILREAGLR